MNLAPFVLYGLVGCQYCSKAEEYFRSRGVPFSVVVANQDIIAATGVKEFTKKNEYPVLVDRIASEVKQGFDLEDYTKRADAYFALVSASSSSAFAGEQQPEQEAPALVKAAPAT